MLYSFLRDQSNQRRPVRLIYQFIYENGSVSRSDIIQGTGLNRGKVARSLKELSDLHLIQLEGIGDSEGGRPPSLYKINSKSSFIIGIQITRPKVEIVLFDLWLHRVDEKVITMTSDLTPTFIMEEIIRTIHHFKNKHHLTDTELLGIGIGAIGPLDREQGVVLQSEPFLKNIWNHLPIVEVIEKQFPVLVKLDNAANTIVLGDYRKHSVYKNVLTVIVSWTWGCGVIHDGQLMKVLSNDISAYGHMVIDLNGKECYCGRKGCITAHSSLYAIVERIKECSPSFFVTKLQGLPLTEQVQNILSAADDQQIQTVIFETAPYVAASVENLAMAYQSQWINLNGPLISYFPGYYEEIIEHLSLQMKNESGPQFMKGDFNSDSGVIGAAVQILDTVMADL